MTATTNISVAETFSRSVPQAEAVEFRRRMGAISRHSASYFAGTLFSAGAGYLFKIYVARSLGAEALGLYALGISIVGVIGVFNAAGLPTAGTRFVAEYFSQRDYARLGAFLRGGFGVLGLAGLILSGTFLLVAPWIAVRFYHAPALAMYSRAFAVMMFLGVLNSFLGQCMAGFQAVTRRSLITQFSGPIVTIVLGTALISLHFGLSGYLAAQVVSAFMVFGLMAWSVWVLTPAEARRAGGIGRIDRRVLAFSTTSFGLAIVHFVLSQADKITLGYYLSAGQVGVYAVAMTIVSLIPIALTSVNQIFSPTIAELHSTGRHALLQGLYKALTKWVLVTTAPLAITVIIFSKSFMTVFGPAFQEGARVLEVGAAGQLFNCAVGSVGFLLLMSGNQLSLFKIQTTNAVAMIVLNLVLVPRFGIPGAAIATSIAVAGTNVWGLIEIRRRLQLFPYDRTYLKLLGAGIFTAAVLFLQHWFLGTGSWRLAIFALGSAYTAFWSALLVLGLETEDRNFIGMAWDKIRRGEWRTG